MAELSPILIPFPKYLITSVASILHPYPNVQLDPNSTPPIDNASINTLSFIIQLLPKLSLFPCLIIVRLPINIIPLKLIKGLNR